MKGILSILVSVLLWSTLPTAVALTLPYVHYANFVFLVQLLAIASFSTYVYIWRDEFETAVKSLTLSQWGSVALTGVFMTVYNLSFYYALNAAPRVEATIIVETWPFVSALLAPLIVKKDWQPIKGREASLIVVAFAGATLVALDTENATRLQLADPDYAVAFLASVATSLGTLMIPRVSLYLQDATGPQATVFAQFLCRMASLPFIFVFALSTGASFSLDAEGMLGIAFIGLIIVGIGSSLFTFGIREAKSPSVTALWYLTPVGAIVLLTITGQGTISDYAVIGAAAVVLSNVLLSSKYRYPSATLGALIFFLFINYVCYFTPTGLVTNEFYLIEVVAVIFAVVSGFALDRTSSKMREEERTLSEIGILIHDLHKRMHQDAMDPEKWVKLRSISDSLFREMIDFDYGSIGDSEEKVIEDIYAKEEEINDLVHDYCCENKEQEPAVQKTFNQLIAAIDRWFLLKADPLSLGESVAITLLGFLTIVGVILERPSSFFGDITAISIATGVFFVMLTIRDFSRNRPDRDFGALMVAQRIFRRNGRRYYVPRQMIEAENFPVPKSDVSFRYYDEDGNEQIYEVERGSFFFRYIGSILFVLVGITFLVLLLDKHFGLVGL